jgi:hypothetical protein
MKSDLNLLQIDDAVDVSFNVRHVTSRPRTLRHVSYRRRRRSCWTRHRERLPEINRLGKHQRFTILILK